MKAHSPIRRWHNVQCRRDVSGLANVAVRVGLVGAIDGDRRELGGVAIPSRRDNIDAAREELLTGVEGTTELARETDGVRPRSGGGAGGRTAQPNKDVMMAVSEGSGVVGIEGLLSSDVSCGSESGTANVGNFTEDTVESNDWT